MGALPCPAPRCARVCAVRGRGLADPGSPSAPLRQAFPDTPETRREAVVLLFVSSQRLSCLWGGARVLVSRRLVFRPFITCFENKIGKLLEVFGGTIKVLI